MVVALPEKSTKVAPHRKVDCSIGEIQLFAQHHLLAPGASSNQGSPSPLRDAESLDKCRQEAIAQKRYEAVDLFKVHGKQFMPAFCKTASAFRKRRPSVVAAPLHTVMLHTAAALVPPTSAAAPSNLTGLLYDASASLKKGGLEPGGLVAKERLPGVQIPKAPTKPLTKACLNGDVNLIVL